MLKLFSLGMDAFRALLDAANGSNHDSAPAGGAAGGSGGGGGAGGAEPSALLVLLRQLLALAVETLSHRCAVQPLVARALFRTVPFVHLFTRTSWLAHDNTHRSGEDLIRALVRAMPPLPATAAAATRDRLYCPRKGTCTAVAPPGHASSPSHPGTHPPIPSLPLHRADLNSRALPNTGHTATGGDNGAGPGRGRRRTGLDTHAGALWTAVAAVRPLAAELVGFVNAHPPPSLATTAARSNRLKSTRMTRMMVRLKEGPKLKKILPH